MSLLKARVNRLSWCLLKIDQKGFMKMVKVDEFFFRLKAKRIGKMVSTMSFLLFG